MFCRNRVRVRVKVRVKAKVGVRCFVVTIRVRVRCFVVMVWQMHCQGQDKGNYNRLIMIMTAVTTPNLNPYPLSRIPTTG